MAFPSAHWTATPLECHPEQQVGNAKEEDEHEPIESSFRLNIPFA